MFRKTDRMYPRMADVSQLTSVTFGRANNADTTKPYPFAEGGMFAFCSLITSIEARHKTRALHNSSLFASGISSNDACGNNAQYLANGGVRYSLDGGTTWKYAQWNSSNELRYNSSGAQGNMSLFFNQDGPKEQCMESQMAASFAAELGISENTEFDMYGSTYYYKNITGISGLLDGEMNVKVFKKMPYQDVSAFNSSGAVLPVRLECVLRISLANGFNLCGDIFRYAGGGCELVGLNTTGSAIDSGMPCKIYLETDQTKFHRETAVIKSNQGVFDFESAYPYVGDWVSFDNYRKSITPYTIVGGEQGGGLLSGACAYAWGRKYWSSVLNERARVGLRAGGAAAYTACAPRYVSSIAAVSATARYFAGFAQVLLAPPGASE